MGHVPYVSEPFRAVCLTCGAAEVRSDRAAALEFAGEHERGHVVLSPAANLARATVPCDGAAER